MKNLFKFFSVFAFVMTILMMGCSKDPEPVAVIKGPTPEEAAALVRQKAVELDQARSVANANSEFNARDWLNNSVYTGGSIAKQGDSTQQLGCPQGDGWATLKVVDKKTKEKLVELKCSTYSVQVGCYESEDFKSRKVLFAQENKYNPAIPYPMIPFEVK